MPVNLVYFTGKQKGNTVLLHWEVEKEVNLSKYIVEKSTDGRYYVPIKAITADGSYGYNYTDDIQTNSSNTVYYRLKKVDMTGTFTYSPVFKLSIQTENNFTVYPNPAKNSFTISTNSFSKKPVELFLIDILGRTVLHQSYVSVSDKTTISIQSILSGNYYLRILTSQQTYTTPIIIAK